MEKKYLLSKENASSIFSDDTKIPEEFINKTGILNAVAVPADQLENIQKKYGVYKLENIDVVTNTSGIVNCDNAFTTLMSNRKNSTLMKRMKDSYAWEPSWWTWLIISVLSFLLCIIFFLPMKKDQAAVNTQIRLAGDLAKHGDWESDRVPGPLDINMREWQNSYKAQEVKDSLQKQIHGIKTNIDSIVAVFENAQKNELAPYSEKLSLIKDSVGKITKKSAQLLLDSAQKEIKGASKKQNNVNAVDGVYYRAEELRRQAAKLLQSQDSVILSVQVPLIDKKNRVEAEYKRQIDSIHNVSNTAIKNIEKTIPNITPYTYDLLHPEEYTKSYGSTLVWWSKWISIACMVIFIGCIIYVLLQMPNREKKEKEKYSDTNLRVMAFTAFASNGTGTCTIEFHNVSGGTVDKLVSARLRYKWNALVHPDAFEFKEPLLEHEKLTAQQKADAPQPLFYAIEGEVAIFYSGLAKQASEDEIKQSTETAIL